MQGRIAILYTAIVAGADESSLFIENGGADRDAAVGEAFAGFGDGDGEHCVVVESVWHWRDYTRAGLAWILSMLSRRDERKAQRQECL